MTNSPDGIHEIAQSNALLLVLLEPPAQLEEEFNDWYDFEHFPQRMGVPGFACGERWVAIAGWPRYLARYKLIDSDVLNSCDYLAISGSNNSPWSKRILPRTIGRRRLALDIFSQKSSHAQAACLCLVSWALNDAHKFEVLLQQARLKVDALTGVVEVQWCRTENLLVCILGFDYIIAQQDVISLNRPANVGTAIMNIYVRYQR